jgi:class 3 adenylate cyclase/alpha-beta hydrolase superfamily lysophospholipase
MRPKTRYARSGDVSIAYQEFGKGPPDLVYIPGYVSHIEYAWEHPRFARQLERLAGFSRVLFFDKRGTGMSDRVAAPTLEERMDDVRSVMDDAGSERAFLYGISEGGPMALLFAATYPERTSGIVLYGTFARWLWAPDYPDGMQYDADEIEAFLDQMERSYPDWNTLLAPGAEGDDQFNEWFMTYLQVAASPRSATQALRHVIELDVRHVLPAIHVPVLVLHRVGDDFIPIEHSRYLAQHVAGARLVELAGSDHLFLYGNVDALIDEIEEFVTGRAPDQRLDRVLATVLFTDIVGSTERAAELGDRSWRDLLEDHHAIVRSELGRYGGREVKTTGDGFLATFDGPARAVRCALAIQARLRLGGLEVRAGLHTGECELVGGDIAGLAVHLGARVCAEAGTGEVLVSSTVRDLVVGSGLAFEDRGTHVLKGVPGEWRLYSVLPGSQAR